MADRCYGMMKQHPWTGETHDFTDLFPHFRLIAVHLAVGTEGLGLHKRAFLAAHSGIGIQRGTFRAKPVFAVVLLFAVKLDHLGNHFLFPFAIFLYFSAI